MMPGDDGPWEPTAAGWEDPDSGDEHAEEPTLENNLGEQQQEFHDSRPTNEEEDDLLQREDPWLEASAASTRQSRSRPSRSFAGAVTHQPGVSADQPIPQGPARRYQHDTPPVWNGKNPQTELEPYLKTLHGWLATTQTVTAQRGMLIMTYAEGDLKGLINQLDMEELTTKDSGTFVANFIKEEYAEYMVSKKPQRLEEALYNPDRVRQRNEGMISYCSRRKDRFRKLEKEGWNIPSDLRGYLLYRDANLSDKCRELIEMWTDGEYEWEKMQTCLKKLERPVPGYHGDNRVRMIGYTADMDNPTDVGRGDIFHTYDSSPEEGAIYMSGI